MYLHIFNIIAFIVAFAISGLLIVAVLNALNERKRLDIEAMQTRLKAEAYRDRNDAITMYRRG